MLAKLITYGETREGYSDLEQLTGYLVEGRNNFAFGKFVFEHEAFRSGNFDTHFVKKYYNAAN
jgi:propionyl-CoA carboxylase alpha chain